MQKAIETGYDEYLANPNPLMDQIPAGMALEAAEDIITLMKRIQRHGYNVRVTPNRLAAKLSGLCSKLVYNLGKIEGYKKAERGE